MDSWICYKICYYYYFSENLVNELREYIKKNLHVTPPQNVLNLICSKLDVYWINKHKLLLQISVCEFRYDIVLPVSQGGLFSLINEYGIVCIHNTLLRNYMTKHINQISNRDNITCWCKTCISFMVILSNLNKYGVIQ